MANLLKANFFRIAGGGWSWLAVASLTLLIAMAYLYILNRAVEGKFGTDMYVHINISASDMRESESVHLLFHHTLATFSTLTGVNVWDAATFVLLFYVLMGGIFLYLVMAYYLKSLVAMQWVVMLTMSLMVIAGIHVP